VEFNKEGEAQYQNYFEEIIRDCASSIFRQKVEIHVEVREGSVETFITVVGSIVAAIGFYDTFRSGIDRLIDDSKTLHKIIKSRINKEKIPDDSIIDSRKLYSTPNRIRRLLLRIDSLEDKSEVLTKKEIEIETRNIIKSVVKLSYELGSQEDFDFILSELKETYRPDIKLINHHFLNSHIYIEEEKTYPQLQQNMDQGISHYLNDDLYQYEESKPLQLPLNSNKVNNKKR